MLNVSVEQKSVEDKGMIFIGILLALAFWILEALIHAFVFQEGELLQKLFPTDPNELWMRTLVCCLLIGFGIYSQRSIARIEKSEEERHRLEKDRIHDVSAQQAPIVSSSMIFLGILSALVFWFIETLIHSSLFNQGELLQNIFPTDPNELWMRTLVSSLLIAIGIYAHSSITKLKKSEEERRRLQRELEESLTKLLSGFIPICANCKDIREEDGTWIQIEGYLQNHSDVKFSHGICQKCTKVLYPHYVTKK